MSNPSITWQRLQAGNQRFYATLRSKQKAGAKDHSPIAVVFRCADADTASEVVLGQSWGSLIDISTWGHVIDTGVLATVEYAVGTLKTPLIVVLGHEHCAAMETALRAWENVSFRRARLGRSSNRRYRRSPGRTPTSAVPTSCRPPTWCTPVSRCCTSRR